MPQAYKNKKIIKKKIKFFGPPHTSPTPLTTTTHNTPLSPSLAGQLRLRLGVYKGMKWNDHKGMESNGMYVSKGNEWKRMEWN